MRIIALTVTGLVLGAAPAFAQSFPFLPVNLPFLPLSAAPAPMAGSDMFTIAAVTIVAMAALAVFAMKRKALRG